MPESTLSEVTLRMMEDDAQKMKSELHVRMHVLALVTEVRRLGASGVARPDGETARLALAYLSLPAAPQPTLDKANAVLDRYFS